MDFDILLEKFLREDLSPEELYLFLAAVKEPANDGVLQKMIAEKLNTKAYQGLSDATKIPAMFRAMLEKAAQKQSAVAKPTGLPDNPAYGAPTMQAVPKISVDAPRRIFIGRRIAAAVIILLAGAGCYFIWVNKQQQPIARQNAAESRFKNDIAPGGNKARLQLANGQIIVLDSTANGILTSQGNTKVMKTGNGQLAYQPADGREPAGGRTANDGRTAPAIVFNTLSTPRGGQYQLTLPDGSRVWLNAASSIRYPTAFTGKDRKVEITGEAYFEITRNAAMPFKVTTTTPSGGRGALEIEVLGTSFNIMAYYDDSTINTTLLEGAVRVTKGTDTRTITPGQQLIAGAEGSMHLAAEVDVQKTIAWKNGKFIFYNDDIRNIMKQLTRWYDIDVRFTGEVHDHYSGGISRQVNISQVLKMLEAAGGVSFSVQGKEVKIN